MAWLNKKMMQRKAKKEVIENYRSLLEELQFRATF